MDSVKLRMDSVRHLRYAMAIVCSNAEELGPPHRLGVVLDKVLGRVSETQLHLENSNHDGFCGGGDRV